MTEEPAKTIELHLTIHLFQNIEKTADRLVVSGMEAKRPAILHKQP